MSALTRYGSFWGSIPETAGNVYWVAPSASYTVAGQAYVASDDNDGLDPRRAKLTLASAISAATANAGDVVVLLPGAHSWAASVAMSKAGITVMGLPGGKGNPVYKRASVTLSASDEIINVTAADIEIAHLTFIPVTQKAAIDFTAAGDRLYVHDCAFDLFTAAAHTSTKGIAATAATINADRIVIENCYFESDGAQGEGVDVGDSNNYIVRGCTFVVNAAGTWARAALAAGVTNQVGLWQSNTFLAYAGATMTDGIIGSDLTSASSVAFIGNFFGDDVTVPIDDFGSGDAYIAENYKGSVGGGSGGVLITAIT